MEDWMHVLEAQCEAIGQGEVARRLGVSRTLISLVRRGKYEGNIARVEELVRGTFMAASVDCPVVGEISRRRCLDEQARPFAATSPMRVALSVACRTCSHRMAKTPATGREGKGED